MSYPATQYETRIRDLEKAQTELRVFDAGVEAKLATLSSTADKLDEKVGRMEQDVGEIRNSVQRIEDGVGKLSSNVSSIDKRLSAVETKTDEREKVTDRGHRLMITLITVVPTLLGIFLKFC